MPARHIDYPQRSLEDARAAYLRLDVEASKIAHTPQSGKHHEGHNTASSSHLRAVVFGGLDGVVTIFAMVAGCVGAKLTPGQTVIVGIGNLLADAVSMGFGEYASAAAEADYLKSEKAREVWEIDNYPEGEKQEMIDIYTAKYGVTEEDATALVNILFKYRDLCISHMMAEELGLLVDDEGPSAESRGVVMFISFICFGVMPLFAFSLWAYVAGGSNRGLDEHGPQAFIAAAVLSMITLFVLGMSKVRDVLFLLTSYRLNS